MHTLIPSVSLAVARVRAWLSANERPTWRTLADAAGVDEKTLRLSVGKSWNPTVNTLQKLEALIPPDWQPDQPTGAAVDGRRRKGAK